MLILLFYHYCMTCICTVYLVDPNTFPLTVSEMYVIVMCNFNLSNVMHE